MNDLLQQRFFRLLSEYSQREVFATELVGAIEELALHLADFSMYEQDNSILHGIFLSDYIVSNRTVYSLSKKKMPYLHLIDEAIGLIDNEIRIVEWRIKYPEQFNGNLINHLFPLSIWLTKQPLSTLWKLSAVCSSLKTSYIKMVNLPTWWIWEKPLNGSLISR